MAMTTPDDTPIGAIPEDNRPGHHPDEEQDKPKRRPRPGAALDKEAAETTAPQRFAFAFGRPLDLLALPFGIRPKTAYVEVTNDRLEIRFGPWSISTPRDNVDDAHVTGPYQWFKVAGPARLSMRDRGITFAASHRQGLCIHFREPVTGLTPFVPLRHPAVTVAVEDPEALARALRR
jgi:hypothetical protein